MAAPVPAQAPAFTLYDLAEELLGLANALESADFTEEERETALAAYLNSETPSGKLEGYCKLHRHLTRQADAIEAEISDLKAKRDMKVGAADRLKERLKWFLETTQRTKVEAGVFTIALQASPPSVGMADDLDPETLPDDLKRVRVEADKKAILERLKSGESVPGCHLKEGSHVRIR